MRVLNGNLESVSTMAAPACIPTGETGPGEETWTFNLPMGFTVQSQLELNNSTTLHFYKNGNLFETWNSGTFVSCFLIGVGVGGIVTGFTGMPSLGSLASFLATQGCQRYVNKTYEDGDTYLPPC